MAETVNMPKLGFDMAEGTLVRWVKKVGDSVQSGDILAEIETDKATVEVESYFSGTLLQVFVKENTVVEVGAPIAIIGEAGEKVDAPATSTAAKTPATEKTEVAPSASASTLVAAPVSAEGYPAGVKASPVARRIAQEQGINLAQVSGTGPGGRVVKRDIEAVKREAPAAPIMAPTLSSTPPSHSAPTGAGFEEISLTRMRKTIAERTRQSFQFVPHFYVTTEIDMGPALELRKQINVTLPEERKVTVNDIIVKAVALTLLEFPNLNTHFHGDKLIRYHQVNIGIAVALESGLINVVCHNADKRTLSDIAATNKVMIARAREGKVRPEDVEGATFTVSNLGAYDVEHFLAIINPPEAAILAVGSAKEVPVVVNGALTIGVRMKATISVDHQVSDGAEGARYMQRLKELLENPLRMLV